MMPRDLVARMCRPASGLMLCLLLLVFSSAVKIAAYHHHASARALATMHVQEPTASLASMASLQTPQGVVPAVLTLLAIAIFPLLGELSISPAPRPRGSMLQRITIPHLALRPPPAR
jgi:hypothetical protein